MEEKSIRLLKQHHLSVTESRCTILDYFLNNRGALSHADIEQSLPGKYDRVTIYRTLQTFVGKGILHAIPSPDNVIRYALCKDECGAGHHHDNHVHFVCRQCGVMTCLEDTDLPLVKLPDGFTASRVEVQVMGVCDHCQ